MGGDSEFGDLMKRIVGPSDDSVNTSVLVGYTVALNGYLEYCRIGTMSRRYGPHAKKVS